MCAKKIHLTEARRTVSVLSPTFKPFRAAQATSVTDGSWTKQRKPQDYFSALYTSKKGVAENLRIQEHLMSCRFKKYGVWVST